MDLHTTDIAKAADITRSSRDTPLLDARGLSVRLGADSGVRDISLTLQRGDIVGLLGLNGAGKSTTLRMLCGVLVPDEGSVIINGLSMADDPLPARAQVGYLPDQPPLYDDMRVSEYLTLTGRIRALRGKRLIDRQAQVVEQCALGDVQRKIIGTLSKGYRQRIGLAQALIHEPAVVLLDEPANGLDPQQMDSMRTLIRQIGEQQAILFSTHLLSEATATCNRVAIIHDGKLVADRPAAGDDLQQLFQGGHLLIGIIARHESATLLRSMQTWIIAALLAGLFGFQFLKQLEAFIAIQAQLAVQDHPIGLTGFMSVRYLEPLALAFTMVAPLFAMRSFSDEFRQQTYALWQSSPVSTTALALGKFLGVFMVLLALVCLAVSTLAVMQVLMPIDWPLLVSSFLGLSLFTAACTACGLYFSSLTQHALVAIVASLALLFISWMLGSATAGVLPLHLLASLSIATHLNGFFQGYIQTQDIAFFLLMIALFLGLTIIRLDSLRQSGR